MKAKPAPSPYKPLINLKSEAKRHYDSVVSQAVLAIQYALAHSKGQEIVCGPYDGEYFYSIFDRVKAIVEHRFKGYGMGWGVLCSVTGSRHIVITRTGNSA